MNFKNIRAIFKKELKSYFDKPLAYIVLVVFLLLWEFLFFRNVFLIGEASLSSLFDILPWLLLFLLPALTMGIISEEKSEGTIEFLLTKPLREVEIIVGKFLSAWFLVLMIFVLTIPLPICLSFFGNIDWGIVVAQYVGALALGGSFIALGIFVSSLFKSQIASLIVALVFDFFFIVVGFELVTAVLPIEIASFLEQISVLSHFYSISRGVLGFFDLFYFMSFMFIFLSLSYLQLLKDKYGRKRKDYRRFEMGVWLILVIVLLLNMTVRIINFSPGLDLTANKAYTLSDGTKQVLKELPDVVNVDVYLSSELPASFQPVVREVKDVLRDYKSLGKGKMVVNYKDPGKDSAIAQEALSAGVQEVQFNTISQEEFQVKKGFLGLAVSFGGESEAIPFIQTTNDLEYRLTSFIQKLTVSDKKRVAFLVGHGEKSVFTEYQLLMGELDSQFELEEVSWEEGEEIAIDNEIDVLVIAGTNQEVSEEERQEIKDYFDQGGSVLFLVDSLIPNLSMMTAEANPNSLADLVEEYGVFVKPNMIYDLASHDSVSLGGNGFNYVLPYPLWLNALAVENSSMTNNIEVVSLPWVSSLEIDKSKVEGLGFELTELLKTTQYAGTFEGSFSLDPQQNFSQENLSEELLAVALSSDDKEKRMVVVADSDFVTDEFLSNANLSNTVFLSQAISWLGQENSLASIKLKQMVDRNLIFENKNEKTYIRYANLAFVALVPIIWGVIRLMRRRNLSRLSYEAYKKYEKF